MLDATDKHVNVTIRDDGKAVWVNIDGICAVRVYDPKSITIDDARQGYEIRKPSYYRDSFDGSPSLFDACWREYGRMLAEGIEHPMSDTDVMSTLDHLASIKVNDPSSEFYIHG